MRIIFEGYGPAAQHAEIESKKQQKEMWVIKTNEGGLKYMVITDLSEAGENEKVMAHYEKGIVKVRK